MLVSIVGTRPNLVKLASIVRAARAADIVHYIIHTGQHYDYELSQIFLEQLEIPVPDCLLSVGSGDDPHQIAETIERVAHALKKLRKDAVVLIYGDTNATVGGAIATRKISLSLGHVESGVRTGDRRLPEEVNRLLAEACADLLFAPTQRAYENIESSGRAVLTGDVMYDTLLWAQPRLSDAPLHEYDLTPKQYYLLTLHRNINVDDPSTLDLILTALAKTGEHFVFPAHPRTQKTLKQLTVPSRIQVIPPLGYLPFLCLLKHARKVVTDSGGVQKEAYALGIPCLTVLDAQVWPETVDAGWNLALPRDPTKIAQAIKEFAPHTARPPVFGDGHAGETIIRVLKSHFETLLRA